MSGARVDQIVGVALSDDDTTVRIEFVSGGRRTFIDFPASQIHAMLPALAQISTPRGTEIQAMVVDDVRGSLGPDNSLRLSLDFDNGSRMTVSLAPPVAAELATLSATQAWASLATGPKN